MAKEHAEQAKTFLEAQGETVHTLGAVRPRQGDEHQVPSEVKASCLTFQAASNEV